MDLTNLVGSVRKLAEDNKRLERENKELKAQLVKYEETLKEIMEHLKGKQND